MSAFDIYRSSIIPKESGRRELSQRERGGMGAATALAEDTPDDKRELCAVSLDMAAVGAIAYEGA